MKFSVIVPIYKVEPFIRQCIESVLDQTYPDLELILVDDGSPDHCPQICDEYKEKDSRVRVLHKENGGLVSARQAGAELASGEYVACLDGDDRLSPVYCEKIADVIGQYHPDAVMFGAVYTDGHTESCHPPREEAGYYTKKDIENKWFPYLIEDKDGQYFSPSIWGMIYKRELYVPLQLSIDETIKIGEDHCLTKPFLYRAQSVYVLHDCLYDYRQNPASMTKDRSVFDLTVPKRIAQHLAQQIDLSAFDFQEQVCRRVVHDLFNASVSQFHAKAGYRAAKKKIAAALEDETYQSALKQCAFHFPSKGWLAQTALKHRLYFLMYLYSKK